MMRYKSSLFLTTWLPVLLANNNPQITQNIQPRYGSLRGETLIRIRGKNFSPNKFDLNDPSNPDVGNRVYLFNDNYEFECDVQVDDSTTDQIMCRTPNNMDTNWEWLSVKVKSDGKWSNVWGWRGFQPRNDRTPYVHHITPTVMEPQSVIRQYGNQYTRSYNSTNTNWPNSKSCPDCAITKIWVGGKECDLYNRTLVDFPRDVYEINMVATKDADGNDIEGSEGRTTNEGYFKCRLTGTKVDYQNFTYIVDQDYGRSRMNRLRKRLAPRGTIYDLQTYAKVDSIENPVSGSNGGGQLKIRGNWFSPLDKDHKVFIDDQECENVQVSEQGTLLTCNPKAGTPSDAETLYEGNRGLFWSIYSGFAGDDATYQSIKDKLEDANDPPTHTMQKFVNGDLVNNDAHFIEAFSAYSAAFFKPVLDSQYQWQLESTDDYGEIYFGDTGSFEDLSLEVQNKLDNSVRKNSAHFDLIGGKSYPIEFFTRDGGGPNFFKPKIMQRDTTWNHQGYHYASNHKQQIQASVAHRNEVQTVTFNNLSPNNLMPYEGTNSSAKICFMCNEPKDNTNPNICDFKMQILGYLTPEFSLTDGLDSAISDALTHHNGRFMSEGNFEVTDYSCRENGAVGIEISHMRTDSIQIIADPALEYEIEYTEGTDYSIEGLLFQMGGNAIAQPQTAYNDTEVLTTAIEDLASTFCPAYFSENQIDRAGVTAYYYDYEGDNSCYSQVSYETAFCGMASRKNNGDLFKAGVANSCDNVEAKSMEYNPNDFKYICFAYLGHLHGGIDLNVYWSDIYGEDQYETKWIGVSGLGNSNGVWKYTCIDIATAYLQNEHNNGLINKVSVRKVSGDLYIDNVQIVKTMPSLGGEAPIDADLQMALSQRVVSVVPPTSLVSVNKTADWTETSKQYSVEFTPVNCAYDYPFISFYGLEASESGNTVTYTHSSWPNDASIVVERTQAATPPLSGSISLDYSSGPSKNSWAQPVILALGSDDANQLVQAYKRAGQVAVKVEMPTNECYSRTWDVTFLRPAGQHNTPVVDDSNAGGWEFTHTLNGVVQRGGVAAGGNAQAGLGAEWFASAHKGKKQVRVFVDGHAVVCEGYNTCNFDYDPSITPEITSVSESNNVITVAGTQLANANVVWPECTRTNDVTDETEIVCDIAATVAAGEYTVRVVHPSKGAATDSTSVNLVTVTNEATSILSQAGENKGSMLGGTRVTIAGSGFTSNTNVNFYNADDADTVPCDVDVDASTVTELVCVTNMPNDDFIDSQMGTYYGASSDKKALIEPGLSKEYQVLINSVDSGLTFWYSPAVTPVVESVTKVNNQDSNDLNTYGGDELSITGYGFVKASSFHVFIDGEEIFYGKSKVRDTSATLSAPALPHGDYSSKFQVSISSVGNAWNYQPENFHLNYVLEISSVSPNSGSINGGTLVTVSGNGFNDEDQIVIKVGDRECDTSCTDCSFAATQVVCRTPPAGQVHVFRPNYLTGNDFDWEENIDEVAVGDTLQFTWNFPEKMRNDKIKMTIYESQIGTNDMVENTEFNAGEATQTGSYSVVATAEGVLSFSTGCMQWSHGACKFELGGQVTVVARSASTAAVTVVSGDDIVEAGGNFNYQDAAVVDSVTVMGLDEDGNPVVSDDNSLPASTGTIVIGGTGFTSNHKVMLGDFECSVDSQSSTEITCYMDLSAEPTLYQWEELSVVDNNQGRAFMQFYRPINAILTADISEITPTTGSLSGGDVVTIRGAGLDMSALQVLFDGVDTCAILTQSYEQITCSAPVFNTGIHAEVQDRSISVQGTPNSSRKRRSTGAVQFNSNGATTDFTQDPSLTPTVNAMTAPANIETGSESFTFVISNYQDTNYEVMIGDAACDIDSANVNGNNLDVTCTLAESPRAGTASIMVKNTNGGAAFLDVSGGTDVIESINVLGAVTAVSPSEGSTLGGTEITITGRGFHDNTVPTINGVECQVADVNSNTKTSIVCVTQETGVGAYDIVVPNVAGSTVEYTFADSATPMLVSSANSEINAGDSIQFSGSNLQAGSLSDITLEIDGKECAVSANDATTITCNAPSLPGGDVGQITLHIDGLGIGLVDNIPLSYTFSISNVSPSTVTVSGGLEVTIYGAGFSETATVSVCDVTGIPINADTYTSDSISFIVPAAADQTQNSNCEVKVVNAPGKEKAWGNTLTYDFDSTPSVSSVSPVSGGSAGGTTLTVLGSGFTNDQKVSISGSECVIDAVTLGGGPNGEDKIVCVTEPWDMTTERRPLVRVYNDLGDAINTEHRFYYIDRWNSVYTWGGDEPPRKDEFVVIEAGKTVMIDGTTEDMKMLLVKGGTIIFDETQPCHLRAQNILITDGGIIQAGTKEEPYTGDLTIEMNGHLRSLELPVYGTKTLGVRDGTLELHGVPKVPTWTLLEETVQANSDTIVVQNPVNWVAGDRLVIATTSHLNSQNENEEVVIKSVSNDGRTITLETGVEFSHLGHTETLENGAVLEMRAEVGILSRNIKFRGSNNPEWNDVIEACPEGFDNGEFATQTCFQGRFGEEIGSDQFGAAIMLHPKHPGTEAEPSKAVARISHLEMNYVGQAFRLSRYPFHLHITGYNNETYFESSSIWQAFNRAFVLHHTDHVTFTNNVVYNVMGGAIFIENGIERFNKITYNFATFVRSSQALLNDDITPATIWITNPQNTVSHNHVGGSTHFGVWYRMRSHPEATSFTTSVCPDFAEMGEFKNNTMHSVGWFGLWVFENWFPHENGHNCQKGTIKPAVFENIRVWRAEKGAEFFKVGAMQARDWITAETRHVGIEFKEVTGPSWGDQTGIHDSTVAARTSLYNDVGGHDNAERAGIIIPAGSGMMIHNTDMIGWGLRDGSHGVTGTNIICRFDKGAGGYETRWSGIRWFNSPTRTLARWGNEFKIVDVDGTFTAADQVDNSLTTDLPTGGAAGVKLITETVGLTDGYGCVKQSGNLYSKKTAVTICPKDLGLNRWGMNTMQPASLDRQTIDFEFNGKNSSHAYRDLDPGETEGWHSVVPTGSNGEYHMYIPKSQGIRNISYAGSVRDLYPGEYIIMQNNVPEEPDEVHLNGVALRLEEPLTADSPHNSWYFDEATNTVSFMIKNTNTPSTRRRKRRGVQFGVQDEGIMNRHFNIFFRKCYWADCIEPPPAVRWDAPPTQRPENFLNTSMSNWQWNEESVDNDFGTMKVPGYISTSTRKRRNPQDLQDGDSLNIPNGQWVVLDRNFDVELDTILVQGGLEFGEGIDYLKVKRIIVLGGILIGTDQVGKQRTAPLEIDFVGTHDDRAIFLGQGNTFGSNGLACLGVCELLGAGPVNTWSKLSATANAGANSVSVEKDCSDWPAGSQVVVTTTSMDGSKTEIMTIASASANAVTFTSNLQYKHRGEATDGNDALIGEISLLSRNIHLHGAADEPEGFGMRIIGGEFSMRKYGSDKPALFSGQMNFEHIEISNYGQMQYYLDEDPRWGLVFQNADADNDDTVKQRVINSVLHHGYAGGIGIFSTDNVIVSGTTVHRAGHNGLKVVDSEGTQINDNICAVHYHIAAMSVFLTGEDKEVTEERWPACFDIEGAGSGVNNTFSGNRASGSGTIGIKHWAHACDADESTFYTNNIARGCMIGYHYRNNAGDSCRLITNLQIANSHGYGMQILDEAGKGQTFVKNSISSNSYVTHANMFIKGSKDHGHTNYLSEIVFDNVKFIGMDDEFFCMEDSYDSNDPHRKSFMWKFAPKSKFSFSGVTDVIHVAGKIKPPATSPAPKSWSKMTMGFPGARAQSRFKNVEFKNIGGRNVCESKKPGVVLELVNTVNKDNQFVSVFDENVTFTNIDLAEDFTKFETPALDPINPGECVDMECDQWVTPLVLDLHGAFTGDVRGALIPRRELGWDSTDPAHTPRGLGDYRIPKTALTNLQGERLEVNDLMPNKGRIRNDACSFSSNLNGYWCTGENAYEYMYLTIENMDHDTQERRLSPLAIISNKGPNGYVDLYNGPARQDWGERLGIFHTTVAGNTTVDVFMTSTPPQHTRMQLQGGVQAGSKVLVKFYNPVPQLIKISRTHLITQETEELATNGFDADGKPINLPIEELIPTSNDAAGTNYHHRDEQTVYVVMDDSMYYYDFHVSDQVLMSFGFPPVSLDDFFEEAIIDNLANFFGIAPENVRYVNVIREDSNVALRRKRRNADGCTQNCVTGVEVVIEPTPEEKQADVTDADGNVIQAAPKTQKEEVASKVTEFKNNIAFGAGETDMQQIFKGTSVSTVVAEVTVEKIAEPIPDERNARSQFMSSIDDQISQGKVDILKNSGVKTPEEMLLSDGPSGFIQERTPIYPSPKVQFYDQNDELVNVGTFNEPWLIEATLVGNDGHSDVVFLQGTTQVQVFNGVADFHNLYIPSRDENNSNQKYSLEFAIVSPQSAIDAGLFVKQTSGEFVIHKREVSATITQKTTSVNQGDLIEYYISLVDNSGNILVDSNWAGNFYGLKTENYDEVLFPSTGDSKLKFEYDTSALAANKFYEPVFMITAYTADDNADPDNIEAYLTENPSEPVIKLTSAPIYIQGDASDLAAYSFSSHFSLKYNLDYSSISNVVDNVKSGFHNKLSYGIEGNDFYISDLAVYAGSIIVEGTIYAKNSAVLATAETHVFRRAMETSEIAGVEFTLRNNCDMQTHAVRNVNTASQNGECYDGAGTTTSSANLQAWAIALIVICVLIFLTLVVFIFICVKNRTAEYKEKA